MKQIDISTLKYPNTFTLVDDEDYQELNRHRWIPTKRASGVYVSRQEKLTGKRNTVCMSREVLKPDREKMVDHINGNPLDNRKCNLRQCSNSQNQANSRIRIDNKSGYKGAYWRRKEKKWCAAIKKDGKVIYLGLFFCLIKAAKAYNEAAVKYHGEFARINIIKENNNG